MAPRKTATQQPHKTPGIRRLSDSRHYRAPWQLSIYHGGKKTRRYFATAEEAQAAQKTALRLQKREGSKAFGYSREAQVEYEERIAS